MPVALAGGVILAVVPPAMTVLHTYGDVQDPFLTP